MHPEKDNFGELRLSVTWTSVGKETKRVLPSEDQLFLKSVPVLSEPYSPENQILSYVNLSVLLPGVV